MWVVATQQGLGSQTSTAFLPSPGSPSRNSLHGGATVSPVCCFFLGLVTDVSQSQYDTDWDLFSRTWEHNARSLFQEWFLDIQASWGLSPGSQSRTNVWTWVSIGAVCYGFQGSELWLLRASANQCPVGSFSRCEHCPQWLKALKPYFSIWAFSVFLFEPQGYSQLSSLLQVFLRGQYLYLCISALSHSCRAPNEGTVGTWKFVSFPQTWWPWGLFSKERLYL